MHTNDIFLYNFNYDSKKEYKNIFIENFLIYKHNIFEIFVQTELQMNARLYLFLFY